MHLIDPFSFCAGAGAMLFLVALVPVCLFYYRLARGGPFWFG